MAYFLFLVNFSPKKNHGQAKSRFLSATTGSSKGTPRCLRTFRWAVLTPVAPPVIFAVILFILSLPPIVPIPLTLTTSPIAICMSSHWDFSCLRTSLESNPSHDILIGLAAIYIVMFSIVAFMYQLRHIPSFFVKDYILWRKETLAITLFFLTSFVTTLSFTYMRYIAVIHIVMLDSLVIFAVVFISNYFRWILWSIEPKSIGEIILNRGLTAIAKCGEELRKDANNFKLDLKTLNEELARSEDENSGKV